MNRNSNEYSKQSNRRRHSITYAGAHPGGGFVALPDGSTSTLHQTPRDRSRLRPLGRKGFVAWPGNA